MSRSTIRPLLLVVLAFAYAMCALPAGMAQKLSAEEIVAKHLEALGSRDARAALSTRAGEGTVEFNERIGGRVHLPGTAAFLSQGHKVKWAFRFAAAEYPGEQLVFDGQATHVAAIDAGNRSRLGNFILDNSEVVREGVWGGTLSAGWALLDLSASGAKVKNGGTKKIDGRELYDLALVPKGGSARFTIHLYFDPATFRHVMTVYRLTGMPGVALDSGQQNELSGEVVTVIEERFDDFRATDGLTLPKQWEIRLRIEPSKGFEYQWKVNWTKLTTQEGS